MNFEAIERRCRDHIREEAARKAKAIMDAVARKVGMNHGTWCGVDDEFLRVSKPLQAYLQRLIQRQLENKLLNAAEDAALAVVKAALNGGEQ